VANLNPNREIAILLVAISPLVKIFEIEMLDQIGIEMTTMLVQIGAIVPVEIAGMIILLQAMEIVSLAFRVLATDLNPKNGIMKVNLKIDRDARKLLVKVAQVLLNAVKIVPTTTIGGNKGRPLFAVEMPSMIPIAVFPVGKNGITIVPVATTGVMLTQHPSSDKAIAMREQKRRSTISMANTRS
jgi:hypothetical protein